MQVFVCLFVVVFLYSMGHFMSTTKIQNYFFKVPLNVKSKKDFQSHMKNAISLRNLKQI